MRPSSLQFSPCLLFFPTALTWACAFHYYFMRSLCCPRTKSFFYLHALRLLYFKIDVIQSNLDGSRRLQVERWQPGMHGNSEIRCLPSLKTLRNTSWIEEWTVKYVRCGIRFTDDLTAVNTADVLMLCLPHMIWFYLTNTVLFGINAAWVNFSWLSGWPGAPCILQARFLYLLMVREVTPGWPWGQPIQEELTVYKHLLQHRLQPPARQQTQRVCIDHELKACPWCRCQGKTNSTSTTMQTELGKL